MKLGIDIDGVLGDFVNPLLRRWNRDYNTEYCYKDLDHYYKLSEWMIEYSCVDYERVEVMPGAREYVEQLDWYHDVYVVTARPAKYSDITWGWLEDNFPYLYEKQLIMCGDKSLLNLDVMIDDAIHNLGTFKYNVIYDHPWNRDCDFIRVTNWQQIYSMFGGIA